MWTGSRTSPVGEFQILIQHFCLGYLGKACSTAPSRRALRNTPGTEPVIQHRRFWTGLPPHLCSTDTYGSVPDLQYDPSIQHTSRRTHTHTHLIKTEKSWKNVMALICCAPERKLIISTTKSKNRTHDPGSWKPLPYDFNHFWLYALPCSRVPQQHSCTSPATSTLFQLWSASKGLEPRTLCFSGPSPIPCPSSPVPRSLSPVPRPLQTELPPPHHFKVSSHYCWTEELNGRWKRYVGLHFKLNQMLTGALKKCLSCLVVCSPQFSWLVFVFFFCRDLIFHKVQGPSRLTGSGSGKITGQMLSDHAVPWCEHRKKNKNQTQNLISAMRLNSIKIKMNNSQTLTFHSLLGHFDLSISQVFPSGASRLSEHTFVFCGVEG